MPFREQCPPYGGRGGVGTLVPRNLLLMRAVPVRGSFTDYLCTAYHAGDPCLYFVIDRFLGCKGNGPIPSPVLDHCTTALCSIGTALACIPLRSTYWVCILCRLDPNLCPPPLSLQSALPPVLLVTLPLHRTQPNIRLLPHPLPISPLSNQPAEFTFFLAPSTPTNTKNTTALKKLPSTNARFRAPYEVQHSARRQVTPLPPSCNTLQLYLCAPRHFSQSCPNPYPTNDK